MTHPDKDPDPSEADYAQIRRDHERCVCGHDRVEHEMYGLCEGHHWTGVACTCLKFIAREGTGS